ncbi:MAG: SRPBCC domain-containing protein, partial [Vicinamibacterales bacterium]
MSDEVRVERRIAAPPAAVYAYLTDSIRWARWQGETARIDPTPGGLFRMTLADDTTA